MPDFLSKYKYESLLLILGLIFFVPYLGAVHLFDWDEVNFAEISREMIVTGDFFRVYVDFMPFWEKPPFFFWMQALAMKSFGVNEFSARLPNAICGMLTLVVLFRMGRRLYSEEFGFLWAIVYLGTVLPHLYFRSGIIDPFFNLFIFSGYYFFIIYYWKREGYAYIRLTKSQLYYLFIAGLLVGMGILTKGPVAYLVVCLCFFVYWIYRRLFFYVTPLHFIFFTIAASLVTLSWYGIETFHNGPWFIKTFNEYQLRLASTHDAGHKGFLGYHFVVLLIGCFPASIFAIRAFFKNPKEALPYQQNFKRWISIFFWVVLILFSLVQSKIVHYSSLCYFPLTFLAATTLNHIRKGKIPFNNWIKGGLIGIGSLYVIAFLALPWVGQNTALLVPLFDDPFAQGNLEAEVNWTGLEMIPGIWLVLILFLSIKWMQKRSKFRKAVLTLFGGIAIFVTLALFFSINNIEAYSQRAAIEFFESKADEDCYIVPFGYKSYGHLFYAKKRLDKNPKTRNWEWLLKEADKPVYVISKIQKLEELSKIKELEEIGRKNGFIFFKRRE